MITLGVTALQNGRPDATSAQHARYPGFTKGDITTIHEIGHCIHAANRGDAFYDPAIGLGSLPDNAAEVSGYAGMNRKEFVAEVFAGLMIGRVFSNQVTQEYAAYGGPM